jgi:hypothetical protein
MRSLILILLLPAVVIAESAKSPAVKQISPTEFQLGKIVIDSDERTISFPAFVEQNEVLLEYLLVSTHGKVHESIFLTEIQALELNIAMKLLGYQASRELIPVLDENYEPTGAYYKASEDQKKYSQLSISVSWKKGDKLETYAPHEFITVESTQANMPKSPWIYSGSELIEGKFQASATGDIIAIFTDRLALINYSGEGREDDTIWLPNKQILPPLGTPVTITLTQTNKPN